MKEGETHSDSRVSTYTSMRSHRLVASHRQPDWDGNPADPSQALPAWSECVFIFVFVHIHWRSERERKERLEEETERLHSSGVKYVEYNCASVVIIPPDVYLHFHFKDNLLLIITRLYLPCGNYPKSFCVLSEVTLGWRGRRIPAFHHTVTRREVIVPQFSIAIP